MRTWMPSGTWRTSLDAAIPGSTSCGKASVFWTAYGPFAAKPLRGGRLTKQGKPSGSFLKHGLAKLPAEAAGCRSSLLEALERMASPS